MNQQPSSTSKALARIGVVVASLATLSTAGVSAVAAPPGTAAHVTHRAAGTPCTSAARACVDLSRQQAWGIHHGHAYGPVPVATGKGNSTPPGVHQVTWKDKNHHSHEDHGAAMPYSVFFDNHGRAIHQGSTHIRSAGCIHVTRSVAKVVYHTARVGDRVEIVR